MVTIQNQEKKLYTHTIDLSPARGETDQTYLGGDVMTTDVMQEEVQVIPWWLVLLEGIAAVIVGLLLLFSPGVTLAILVQVLGLYWIIKGVLALVSLFVDRSMWGWKLFVGILSIIAGVIVLDNPIWSAILVPTIVVWIVAIQAIIVGVVNIIQAFRGGGWGIGILGVLAIILGILLIGMPLLATAATAALTLAFLLLIGGVVAIVYAFRMR
jgi:uncharacterized membrane protein HdeD (DUF308 family)